MGRRSYLDWLRGIAVLIMVEAHTFNSWTAPAERGDLYRLLMVAGGFGAPAFLLLAGVAMPLAIASRIRKGIDAREADEDVRIAAHGVGYVVVAHGRDAGSRLGVDAEEDRHQAQPAVLGRRLVDAHQGHRSVEEVGGLLRRPGQGLGTLAGGGVDVEVDRSRHGDSLRGRWNARCSIPADRQPTIRHVLEWSVAAR